MTATNSTLTQSFLIHFALFLLAFALVFSKQEVQVKKVVKFKVIEKPVQKEKKVEIGISQVPKKKVIKKKAKPKKKIRKVFGASRKSLKSSKAGAPKVKQGNTIVKEVDQKKLKKDDLDELPIPKAEYLVTEMPSVLTEVQVNYPEKAKAIQLEGTVTLSILIDDKGVVRDASVVEGLIPEIDEEALRAIKGFVFSPAKIEEKSVPVRIRYAINFVLEKS